ncbi:hypothetical protein L2E82_49190 [Cichorium intybus]|uniref:Uncharacterized protein n=1 Tax=Cichorium intybus TaxID=13427 RepID=A0ACB8YZM1_CICIN|nr:hypothetical protein L2E82_49190 [Cichorium intybus]
MAVVTVELEVTSSLPAPKLFKVFNDFDTIAAKVEPETYKAVNTIQGDGGVGTIKSITYGDGVPFTSSKHKVDAVDANNFSYSYTLFEGDVLMGIVDSASHHVKFVPSADGGSVYKHTVVFNCKGDGIQLQSVNCHNYCWGSLPLLLIFISPSEWGSLSSCDMFNMVYTYEP